MPMNQSTSIHAVHVVSQTLMKRFDKSGKNRISYHDFVSGLMVASKRPVSRPSSRSVSPRTVDAETRSLARSLEARIRRHVGRRSEVSVQSVLASIPARAGQTINKKQLHEILARLGYRLLDSEVDLLFAAHDPGKTGELADSVLLHTILEVDAASSTAAASTVPATTDKLTDDVSAALATAVSKMNQQLRGAGRSAVESVFRAVDTDGCGKVSLREFGRALRSLGLQLSDQEVESVFNKYDSDHNGNISFGEFLDAVLAAPLQVASQSEPPSAASSSGSKPIASTSAETVDALLARLVVPVAIPEKLPAAPADAAVSVSPKAVVSAALTPTITSRANDALIALIARIAKHLGGRSREAIQKVFATIDCNRSGFLSRTELASSMKALGYELLPSELDDLFSHLDRNKDGRISEAEFLDHVITTSAASAAAQAVAVVEPEVTAPAPAPVSVPPPAVSTEKVLNELVARIKRGVGSTTSEAVLSVFQAVDTNHSGKVSKAELGTAMLKLGYGLLNSEIDTLFSKYDANRDGTLSISEFASLIAGDAPAPGAPKPAPAVTQPAATLVDAVTLRVLPSGNYAV